MPREHFIRPHGGEWRPIPSGVIIEAKYFLQGGTDQQISDYAAGVMEISGSYEVGIRESGTDPITILIAGMVPPRKEGDPILTLPEGSRHPGARLIAHYINPSRQ